MGLYALSISRGTLKHWILKSYEQYSNASKAAGHEFETRFPLKLRLVSKEHVARARRSASRRFETRFHAPKENHQSYLLAKKIILVLSKKTSFLVIEQHGRSREPNP